MKARSLAQIADHGRGLSGREPFSEPQFGCPCYWCTASEFERVLVRAIYAGEPKEEEQTQ